MGKIRFALIGAAGFVAPRHMWAIKDVGGELVAAIDPHDSVGVLDQYFPNCKFFTQIELFDRHMEKLRRQGNGVQYVSICSPNFLHDAHCRLALRLGADAICEKPLVLNARNLDALKVVEGETGRKIHCILQLRHDPGMQRLKSRVASITGNNVDIVYITPRGDWYDYSWKGDIGKSGGVGTNIGIHLFDLVTWIFGKLVDLKVTFASNHHIRGFLVLDRATVNFYLSVKNTGAKVVRTIKVGSEKLDLSENFFDLHTQSYREILEGRGFGLEDARASIAICELVRSVNVVHPLDSGSG